MHTLTAFWQDDRAEDVVEYGLIAALVSLICISAIRSFGLATVPFWQRISTALSGI